MTSRTPAAADAEAVAALLTRVALADGDPPVDADETRLWLTSPGLDPSDFQLFELGGEPVAYADVTVPGGQSEKAWADVRTVVEHRGGPVEEAALRWAEERAARHGVRRLLTLTVPAAGHEPLLEARGYRQVRHSFTMTIDLREPTAVPEWPAGVAVRRFEPGEERAVHAAADEAFADHWEHTPAPFDHWLHHMTEREGHDPSLWFVALVGGEIVGVCLCRVRDGERGWCDTLAVRRPWRRRGLGSALLLHAFAEFRARGLARAGLGVDGENTTGAVTLYERLGMQVTRRYDTWERALG